MLWEKEARQQDVHAHQTLAGERNAIGAGFGCFSLCHASYSISSEKLKMTSRISLCVSMTYGTGSWPPGCQGPQRHTRRAASQPPRHAP